MTTPDQPAGAVEATAGDTEAARVNGADLGGGTPYDGDPRFEALVFGWACSDGAWNGVHPTSVAEDRARLADLYAQYLEQGPADDVEVGRPVDMNAARVIRQQLEGGATP